MTQKEEECRPELGLAANMARLMVSNAGSLLKVAAAKEIPQSFASRYALEHSEVSDQDNTIMMPALISKPINLLDSQFKSVSDTKDDLDNHTNLSGDILSMDGTMIREGKRLNVPVNLLGININILSFPWVEGLSGLLTTKKR